MRSLSGGNVYMFELRISGERARPCAARWGSQVSIRPSLSRAVIAPLVTLAVLSGVLGAVPTAPEASAATQGQADRIIDRTADTTRPLPTPEVGHLQHRPAPSASVAEVLKAAPQPEGPPRLAPLQGTKLVYLDALNSSPQASDPLVPDSDLGVSGLGGGTAGRPGQIAPRGTESEDPPLRAVQTSPADNAVSVGTTPVLKAKIAEPLPNTAYEFWFTVCPGSTNSGSSSCGNSAIKAESGWVAGLSDNSLAVSWTVPSGKLATSATYSWSVAVRVKNAYMGTIYNTVRLFATGATLSYSDAASPALVSPADVAILNTRQPILTAKVVRPVSGATYEYQFSVYPFGGDAVWTSAWGTSATRTVPASALNWNRGYYWSVSIRDNPYMGTLFNPQRSFYPIVPVAPTAQRVATRSTPSVHGVSIGTRQLSLIESDAHVSTVGVPLDVTRSYSGEDSGVRALGTGWSSVLDMSVTTPTGAPGPVVRFADGHDETFAVNPDGSYAAAPGGSGATLSKCATCANWTVTDGSGVKYTLDAYGLKAVTTAAGHATTVTRDTSNRPLTLTDSVSGRKLALTWTGSHVTRIEAQPAPTNVTAAWTYAYSSDRLIKVCRPRSAGLSDCTSYAYANTTYPNKITSITTPLGTVSAKLVYTSAGEVQSFTDAVSAKWTFARTDLNPGTRVTVTDPRSAASTYDLDSVGRLTRLVDAAGGVQTWAFDAYGRLGKYVDAKGSPLELRYDRNGHLVSRTTWRDADTAITQDIAYYPDSDPNAGKLKSISDPGMPAYGAGFVYDTQGRLTQRIAGLLNPYQGTPISVKYAYTAGSEAAVGGGTTPKGLLASITDELGAATQFRYSAQGSLREREDPSGLVTTYGYDSLGRVTSAAMPTSGGTRTTTTTYYDDGAVRTSTGPLVNDPTTNSNRQQQVRFDEDADGRVVSVTRRDTTTGTELATQQTFDGLDRPLITTDPTGTVIARRTYDPSGAFATSVDAAGATTRANFDLLGRQTSLVHLNYVNSTTTAAPVDLTLETLTYDPVGNVATRTDADGQTWRYTYTRDSLPADTVATNAPVTGGKRDIVVSHKEYDSAGNVIRESQNDGTLVTVYSYDGRSRPVTATTNVPAAGSAAAYTRRVKMTYDDRGNLTRQQVDSGDYSLADRFDAYTYDSMGRLTSQSVGRDSSIATTRYGYDLAGQLTKVSDPRASQLGDPAYTTEYGYDAAGLLTTITEPQVVAWSGTNQTTTRPTTSTGYDAFGRWVTTLDPNGARTGVTYDDASRPTTLTLPAIKTKAGTQEAATLRRSYNADSTIATETDVAGRVTRYTYDTLGRPVKEASPGLLPGSDARITTSTWTAAGHLSRQTDAGGDTTRWTYDELGRQTEQAQILGNGDELVTVASYDAAGNLATTRSPAGGVTRWSYDALGNTVETTDPDGVTTTFAHDLAGRVTREADEQGAVQLNQYDPRGLLTATQLQNSAGATLSSDTWTYDAAGNELTAPFGSTSRTNTWDGRNNLTSVTWPDNGVTSLGYTLTGQRARLVDQRGAVTTTQWNDRGLRTSVIEPPVATEPVSDRTWEWSYDVEGNPVRETLPGGVTRDRTFNGDGLVIDETGSGTNAGTASRAWEYDVKDRLVAFSHPQGRQTISYDSADRATATAGPAGDATYEYDNDGRPTKIVDASGTTQTTWTPAGRLSTWARSGLNPATYTYDNAGRPQSVTLGQVAERNYQYDAAGRLTSDEVKSGGTSLWKETHQYDQHGRITQTDASSQASTPTSRQYSYDPNGRLASWRLSDYSGGASYGYDKAGNRTSASGRTLTYDARNRLVDDGTAQYTWTPRGTLASRTTAGNTNQYTFDAFDRLTNDGTAAYSYDALDRIAAAGTTRFSYGTDAEPVATGSNTWARSPDGKLVGTDDGWRLGNQRGDLVSGISPSGALAGTRNFSPLGAVVEQTGQSLGELGYQGDWTSTTGDVHMQARWYNPSAGVFLSRDDIDLPLDQENRYSYASGDPVNSSDPTGHLTEKYCRVKICTIAGDAVEDAAKVGSKLGRLPKVGPVGAALTVLGLGSALIGHCKNSGTCGPGGVGSGLPAGYIAPVVVGLNLHLGNLHVPNLKIGNLGIGNINIPDLKIPDINIGNIRIGKIRIGNINIPNINLDLSGLGNLDFSSLNNLNFSNLGNLDLSNLSNLDLGSLGDLDLSGLGGLDIPGGTPGGGDVGQPAPGTGSDTGVAPIGYPSLTLGQLCSVSAATCASAATGNVDGTCAQPSDGVRGACIPTEPAPAGADAASPETQTSVPPPTGPPSGGTSLGSCDEASNSLGSGTAYSVAYQTLLGGSSYPGVSRAAHFQEANANLLREMNEDERFAQDMDCLIPGLRDQLQGPRTVSRRPPKGWTWHHATQEGVMQLVPRIQHQASGPLQQLFHPGGQGGFNIWGVQ